jgi:hypothetical protein
MKIKKGDTRSDGGNTKPGEVFQAQKGAMNKELEMATRQIESTRKLNKLNLCSVMEFA